MTSPARCLREHLLPDDGPCPIHAQENPMTDQPRYRLEYPTDDPWTSTIVDKVPMPKG